MAPVAVVVLFIPDLSAVTTGGGMLAEGDEAVAVEAMGRIAERNFFLGLESEHGAVAVGTKRGHGVLTVVAGWDGRG